MTITERAVSNFDEQLDGLRRALRQTRRAIEAFGLGRDAMNAAEILIGEIKTEIEELNDSVRAAID